MNPPFEPLFQVMRGKIVESTHFGAAAAVNSRGEVLFSVGDPRAVVFLRSSAKPFQALPFVERGGPQAFGLIDKEIALLCASHSGTDEHVQTLKAMQAKIGISVNDLQCGAHYPYHEPTADAMKIRGEQPTPYRHNCSGKHSGMLAHAKLRGLPLETYLSLEHPVQQSILQAFAEMCNLRPEEVQLGIDGCSAPNFAAPLRSAALAYARLCDPWELAGPRAQACGTLVNAMMQHPDMVGGPERFDTRLMEIGAGKIVVKGGAEGYQALGLLPGAIQDSSAGVGIVIKISDGDPSGRARHAVALEILVRLGALSTAQQDALREFGPHISLYNFRHLLVGEGRPAF